MDTGTEKDWAVFRNPVKYGSISMVFKNLLKSSWETLTSAVCFERHSREPILPSTHSFSTARHSSDANRSNIMSTTSFFVIVPSKSIKNFMSHLSLSSRGPQGREISYAKEISPHRDPSACHESWQASG